MPIQLLPRLPGYVAWLGLQVMRSNLDVAARLLRGRRAISLRTLVIDTRIHDPLGQAIRPNSITLTPGTVGLEDGKAIVHTLTRAGAARVARLEGS